MVVVVGALLAALTIRVAVEQVRMADRLQAEQDPVAWALLLAESARWSWPLGAQGPTLLEAALDQAEALRGSDPRGSRAIAEEVRATLFVTRVGAPSTGPLRQRADRLIVEGLLSGGGLSKTAAARLQAAYHAYRGPRPWAYTLSSLGFILWLGGIAVAVRSRRRWAVGAGLAVLGLAAFVGFLAVA